VIRAFQNDLPYDQFVRWQLAGDEYEPGSTDAVAATGFLAAGPFAALPDRLMEDERLRNRYNELDDMLSDDRDRASGADTGCARCHDHKSMPFRHAIIQPAQRNFMGRAGGGASWQYKDTVLAWRDRGAVPQATWLFQRGNYYDRDQPVS
jgi:hypothetical protein